MKKLVTFFAYLMIIACVCTCLVGCSSNGNDVSNNKEQEKEEEIINILTNTNYTYDTLVSDLKEYCSYTMDTTGKLFLSEFSYRLKSLKNNDSVKPLLDMTLDSKLLEENFEEESLYELCKLYVPEKYMKDICFEDWEYYNYVFWDDIYEQYIPFNFEYLRDNSGTKDWLTNKVATIIKQRLKDPGSLQIDKDSVYFYIQCDNAGQIKYLSNGVYNGDIYFYVEYRAKNSFGGYINSGIWLKLDKQSVYWTGLYYKSDMMTYGQNKELDQIGSMFIEYNSQI